MNTINEETYESWYDDLVENSVYEYCPMCGPFLDDADYDFQICHRCGWDGNIESESKESSESYDPIEDMLRPDDCPFAYCPHRRKSYKESKNVF